MHALTHRVEASPGGGGFRCNSPLPAIESIYVRFNRRDDMSDAKPEFTNVELKLVAKAAALAAEQLKLAKQIVTEGGFASAAVAPVLVAAVLQAIAINQNGLR